MSEDIKVSGGWWFPIPGPEEDLRSNYPLKHASRRLKITAHISYYDVENRREYLQRQVAQLNNISADVDIFIHTNVKDLPFVRGAHVVYHDLTDQNPHYLTWKHRDLMKSLLPFYDVFIYLEDDILFTERNYRYWLAHHERVRAVGDYLGFVRMEHDGMQWWCTDIVPIFGECCPLPKDKTVDGERYVVNTNNYYTGFWIADHGEMLKFTRHQYWDLSKCPYYNNFLREKSAIGCIAMFNEVLLKPHDEGAFVHHMPNNYIGHDIFAKNRKIDLFR